MHKLSDGTLFDASKPLAPFDHKDWLKGLKFDLSSKRWGGKGWEEQPDGTFKREDRTIRINKPKPAKKVREIKPAIVALTNDDSQGRTIEEHRAIIDRMGNRYDNGCSPLTKQPITDREEANNIRQPREHTPWRDNRYTANRQNDGMELLMAAFKAQADECMDDDI